MVIGSVYLFDFSVSLVGVDSKLYHRSTSSSVVLRVTVELPAATFKTIPSVEVPTVKVLLPEEIASPVNLISAF